MKNVKKIQIEREGKTMRSPISGKILYNESLEFQDKVKVRFLVGPFAGVVQELPELKAKRLVTAKKAEYVKDKDTEVTPNHEISKMSSGLARKKDETGKAEKKDKGA